MVFISVISSDPSFKDDNAPVTTPPFKPDQLNKIWKI